MAPKNSTVSLTARRRSGGIELRVLGCDNLPDTDGPGNKSDPYVRVLVGADQHQTKVADSLSPVYEEKTSTFSFSVREPVGTEVQVEVWDRDRLSRDDLMGRAAITLTNSLLSGIVITLPLGKAD
jgi:Ca2+-dependent lipid-binding protein